MSSPIKLSGTLPGGGASGLGSVAIEMTDHPRNLVPVIMLIDCSELRVDTDTGEVVPRARIRRIEPITGEDLVAGRRLFRRAYGRRTGRDELPLEFEEELDSAFPKS